MKKIVISVFFPIIILAQSISELGVAPSYIVDSDTLFNGNPYGVGRGAKGGVDID